MSFASRLAWSIAVALVSALLPAAAAQAQGGGAEGGLAWLRAHQGADGRWLSDERLAVRDTATAFATFRALVPEDAAILRAVDALSAGDAATVDLEARRLEALAPLVPEVLLAAAREELAAAAAPDGGWGLTAAFGVSDGLDTALATRALLRTSAFTAARFAAMLPRLRALQGPDGGFAQAAGEPPDVATTAEALVALTRVGEVADVSAERAAAAGFLIAAVNFDGGWGSYPGGPSHAGMTALALRALLQAGANLTAAYVPARDYLLASQSADGSWGDDPYVTALATLAIGDAPADLAIDEVTLAPRSVPQGTPSTVTVRARNAGVSPSIQVEAALFHGDPARGGTRIGSRVVPSLGLQGTTDLVFTVETGGLLGSIALFAVIDPADDAMEMNRTNNRRIVILDVRRPQDPEPPSGSNRPPAFTSVPPTLTPPGALFTYQVTAVDPEGEAVTFALIGQPTGMVMDGTGLVTWNVPDQQGATFVTIAARDPAGATAQQTFRLEVRDPNQIAPPLFRSLPSSAAAVDSPYGYEVDVIDRNFPPGPITLSFLVAPSGMIVDPATHAVAWTPTVAQRGDNLIRLQARSTQGLITTQEWIIFVDAPDVPIPDLAPFLVDLARVDTDPQSLYARGTVSVSIANQGTAPAGAFKVVAYVDRDGIEGYDAARDGVLGELLAGGLAVNARLPFDVPVEGVVQFRDNRVFVFVDSENVVAERNETNNVWASGREQRFVPTPGSLDPQLKHRHTVFTIAQDGRANEGSDLPVRDFEGVAPVILNLNDDDGDGRAGPGDVPDVVMRSSMGNVVALDGRTGRQHFALGDFMATAGANRGLGRDTGAAAADIDGDGRPEIVVMDGHVNSQYGGVRLLEPNGDTRWLLSRPLRDGFRVSLPSWVDLHGDGTPEIVTTTDIVGGDGNLRCVIPTDRHDEMVAVDLDLDGTSEIVAPFRAYNADCSIRWSLPESFDNSYENMNPVAPGQFDSDPFPELVVMNGSSVRVLEHTGELKWQAPLPGTTHAHGLLVVDWDHDGQSEIIANQRLSLTMYETDGVVRWRRPANTYTILSTVAADLDGDGLDEILTGDNDAFVHGIRARDGVLLFSVRPRVPTDFENIFFSLIRPSPVVADADGDGVIDIVWGSSGDVVIYSHPAWAPGRPLWNQDSYHLTNIRCNQTIPAQPLPSWQAHGTYRQGGDVPDGLRENLGCPRPGFPDLTVSNIRVERDGCPGSVRYLARIGNGGDRTVLPGVEVAFRQLAVGDTVPTPVGSATIGRALAPGDFEDVSILIAPPAGSPQTIVVQVDPAGALADADRANDTHSFTASFCDGANRAPRFVSTPPATAVATRRTLYPLTAEDADADPLTFSLIDGPAGMAIAGGPNPTLTFTPSLAQIGPHFVSIEVSDGRGGLDVQAFLLDVIPPPFSPPPPAPPVPEIVLAAATDATSYGPAATVTIDATLTSTSQAGRTGTFRIEVLDAAGGLIAAPVESELLLLTGPGTRTFTATFDTRAVLPGTFTVRTLYREGQGESTAEASFSVTADSTFSAELTTDRVAYGAAEDVRLTSTLRHTGLAGSLHGLEPALEVLDPSGVVIGTPPLSPVDLAPGGRHAQTAVFGTGTRPSGSYRARLTVRQAAMVLAVVEKTFTIEPSTERGRALAGGVAVAPAEVAEGADVTLTAVLRNVGNVDLTGLEVRLRVHDPSRPGAVRESVLPLDLAMGGQAHPTATFNTVGLFGTRAAVLEVALAGAVLLTDSAPFAVVDLTAPVVQITVPGCAGGDVTPTVSVVEAHPGRLDLTLDGQPYAGGPVTAEQAHRLDAIAIDASGNTGSASASFVIDRTPPAITVTGVSNGVTYPGAVTPVVAFADANLTSTTLTLDGAPFASGTPVSAAGSHTLVATATDCAGHVTTATVTFQLGTAPSTCGNGAFDLYPPGQTPAPCPAPGTETVVRTRAELDAWLAGARTTSVSVNRPIDMGGAPLRIVTACDVTTQADAELTGITDLFIAARRVDFGSDGHLGASGVVELRGGQSVIVRQRASFTGPLASLSYEAPLVDDHGDAALAGAYCIEGDDVIVRQASRQMQAGAIQIAGGDVDLHGDFTQPGRVDITSSGPLIHRQASRITGGGTVAISAAGLMDLHGELRNVQAVSLSAREIIYRQSALIDGGAGVTVTATGPQILDFHGVIATSGAIAISSPAFHLRQSGELRSNGGVTVTGSGRYDLRGKVNLNGDVRITTGSYRVYSGASFTGNTSCVLRGAKITGSVAATGCTEVP